MYPKKSYWNVVFTNVWFVGIFITKSLIDFHGIFVSKLLVYGSEKNEVLIKFVRPDISVKNVLA